MYLAAFEHKGRLKAEKSSQTEREWARNDQRRTKAKLDRGWRERAIWYSASEMSYSNYTSAVMDKRNRGKYVLRRFRGWTATCENKDGNVGRRIHGNEEISF